jgi:hypothetical protein
MDSPSNAKFRARDRHWVEKNIEELYSPTDQPGSFAGQPAGRSPRLRTATFPLTAEVRINPS